MQVFLYYFWSILLFINTLIASAYIELTLCYVQMHPSIAELMKNAEVGVPYPGAKPRYILDIDHASYACRVIATLWEHIP